MRPSDFPLAWPPTGERTPASERLAGRFRTSFQAAYDALVSAAEKLHDDQDREVIISSNVPIGAGGLPIVSAARVQHADPGVAVYIWRGGQPYAIACDTYGQVAHNLRALASTIEALRTVQRHGSGTLLAQSMRGFERAIEAPPSRPMLAREGESR